MAPSWMPPSSKSLPPVKSSKKMNDPPPSEKEETDLKFQQEIAVLSSLQKTPYVVKIFAYTRNPNTIVTPVYLGDLSSLIHNKAAHKYNSRDALDMANQLILGMREIHSIWVAYRDFKPKNVLLEANDQGGFILKISDFGVCYAGDGSAVHS